MNIEDFRNYAHKGAATNGVDLESIVIAVESLKKINVTPKYLLVASEVLQDFVDEKSIAHLFIITEDVNRVNDGYIGKLMGMEVYTDFSLHDQHMFVTGKVRVLEELPAPKAIPTES